MVTSELLGCLDELSRRDLLPSGCRAAYVTGSLARGWANPLSDVDIYLVCDEPWRNPSASFFSVPLRHPTVATTYFHAQERRWELKYWTTDQVDQLLDKVSWAEFEAAKSIGQILTRDEEQFLERMLSCHPLTGADWIARQQERIASSAFQAFVVSYCLTNADDFAADALGQLASDDVHSAVLSARQAFGHVVDALVASQGEVGRLVKWRARRMATVRPAQLSYERYWQIETMRTFDQAAPAQWVEEVVSLCKALTMEVEI